jgi:hypothetical protein
MEVELTRYGASPFCLLVIPLRHHCLLHSSHIFQDGGYHFVIAAGFRMNSMAKLFVGGAGICRKTDHFRHTSAYHNTDELTACCRMIGYHDIHALLHGFFHRSFLYSYSQPSVNCIYLNAAICLLVLLYRVFQKELYNFESVRNLYRGHTQPFELSKCSKTHRVLPRIVIRNCFDLFFRFLLPHYQWKSH